MKKILYPEIAQQILEMIKVDQDMRERNKRDKEFWDDDIDLQNTLVMKRIVAKIGWPTSSKVGVKASKGAWLLVQHADREVVFQETCLKLMKNERPPEVELEDIAYLEDRIRVNTNRPQVFGTQFTQKGRKHILRPIENPESVDSRRAIVGLPSLEEGIKDMYRRYPFPKKLSLGKIIFRWLVRTRS